MTEYLLIETKNTVHHFDWRTIARFLADPDLFADGTVYADVLAKHGLNEQAWDAFTLGSPRMLTWKEGQGFKLTEVGTALAARAPQNRRINSDVTDPRDMYRAVLRDGRITLIPDPNVIGDLEPDTLRFGSRLITLLGAFHDRRWRIGNLRLEHEYRPGTELEPAHAEALRQIIRHDLSIGGADKVEDTLATIVRGVTIDSVSAVFKQGLTDSTVTVYASGLIVTDIPTQVNALLNTTFAGYEWE